MAGITPGTYLFLLQDSFFREDNPLDALIIGAGLGFVIIIAIVVRVIRGGSDSSDSNRRKKSGTAIRKFNAFTFHRVASAFGLDRENTKLLEHVFKNEGVSDPEKVMKTPHMLDRHFKRTFRTIEKNSNTDEDAQERLLRLYTLRNAIESAPVLDGEPTTRLTENTPAIISCEKDSYPVKILVSRAQVVVTDFPKNALGSPIRLNKGTKVSLSFFTKSSNGFSYQGQVIGSVNTDHGPGLQINHNGKMKPLVKRKYRRRQTDIHCEFFFVNIEETGSGRKKVSRLVVEKRRFTGNVQDISNGGCSLKTPTLVHVGSRLKISLDYDPNYPISVLGQVIRSNRSSSGTILHIKFVKVPRRAYNSISGLVFGYHDD